MRIPKTLAQIGTGLALGLMILSTTALAQVARYFRVAGPVPVTITNFTQDGTVTWSNTPTNATFTVQTATDLAASNWVDWVQVPASNATTIHRICDPNPPVGTAFIPAGSFVMGNPFSGEGASQELPMHTVYISAFYMDKYEVTRALWDEVRQWATNHGYSFDYADSGQGKAANHPVHSMTWYDMVKWCNARSEKEGRTPAYYTSAVQTTVYRTGQASARNDWVKWNAGYRLPTEAEWEKAALGGASGQRFPWGNTISHGQANYRAWQNYSYDLSYPTGPAGYHPTYNTGGTPYTNPVGSFVPNGYGLYDTAGNVYEWCWDWREIDDSYYSFSPASDPRGPISGAVRVGRGGCWDGNAFSCRSACRSGGSPSSRNIIIGFRCVLPSGQ